MPRVVFTPNLARHVHCPPVEVAGTTVRDVLEAVFRDNVALRGYVLDDQGRVRKHMAVFLDGAKLADPVGLTDRVGPGAEIYVAQALSGG